MSHTTDPQPNTSSAQDTAPLQTLYDAAEGVDLPLSPELRTLYGGALVFPAPERRPYVFANFVETLDGVVALGEPGASGGGEISGFNAHDRMVMGLLRAAADAVVIGAGTLRSDSNHLWTAAHIFQPLASAYATLRARLGKSATPVTVVITGSGEIDLTLPVFQSSATRVLVVTTARGRRQLERQVEPRSVTVVVVDEESRPITARDVLTAVQSHASHAHTPCERILVEGGPHLFGDFLAERCLDGLFLTLAPQIAGRTAEDGRLAFVAGRHFAPASPLWATLVGVKRAGSHLLLRYAFEVDVDDADADGDTEAPGASAG